MSLELNSKIKSIVIINLVIFFLATTAHADPVVAGEIIPPASATFIDDPDLIKKIGVGREEDPVWCYSHDANAIIITAPQREREKCKLKLKQQKEKLEALHKLQVDTLQLELDSLTERHESLMLIKNKEIEQLTKAALKRPNDYSMWWATGGLMVGVLSTLAIVFAVK